MFLSDTWTTASVKDTLAHESPNAVCLGAQPGRAPRMPAQPPAAEDSRPVLTPASFAAGCVAGAAGQLIGHPLDTIKVYAQTQGQASGLPVRVLFRGVFMPVVTAGGTQSVRLGLYETFRRCWSTSEAATPLAVVGLASGAASSDVKKMSCKENEL